MEPDWNDFRILLALAQSGSVAGAARLLSVDNSTVSRRLAAIESALEAQLLVRGGREFSWTVEGRLAIAAAERMSAPVLELIRAVRAAKHGVEGTVRISCATGVASALSALPALARGRYPALTVQVSGKMSTVDLAKGETDIALRMFKPSDPGLVVRKGVDVGWVLVASESYVAKHGLPCTEAALPEHALVLYDTTMLAVSGPRWLEERRGNNPGVARFDSTDAATYAIASGAGIGVTPYTTVHDRAGIVRVFPNPVVSTTAWIVYHEASRDAARIRAVVELLVEYFDQHEHLFSGEPGGATKEHGAS